MEVRGYKAFNKDRTNRYGVQFEEGKSYHIDGNISFGNHGNGYHMCKYLSREDGAIFLLLFMNNPNIIKYTLYYVYGRESAFVKSKEKIQEASYILSYIYCKQNPFIGIEEKEEEKKKALSYGKNNNQGRKGE